MSEQCEAGWEKLKRPGWYLVRTPRLAQRLERQDPPSCVLASLRTRRSTTCNILMHGNHFLKMICSTFRPQFRRKRVVRVHTRCLCSHRVPCTYTSTRTRERLERQDPPSCVLASLRTRRSTTCNILMHGNHFLKMICCLHAFCFLVVVSTQPVWVSSRYS